MPFNSNNAPVAFMDLMNRALHKYLEVFLIFFVDDDIFIYTDNEELHE